MKTLIFTIFIIGMCFGRTIDSCGVFPFGPDFDLRKTLIKEDVIKKFGLPKRITPIKNDSYMHYSNMACYFFNEKLYSIEITRGTFQSLKIGMSKKKIKKVYGTCSITETLPNTEELQEFGYYDDKWVRYIVTLFLKNERLTKIMIRKEDGWL